MKMTILYGYAPNDMPILTANGYMPRLDWLKKEEERLNAHGIATELKHPESGKYKGQSALKVQDKGWTHEQWEKMRRRHD